ncbi:prolyl oligopeptidase family serine peptidase [Sphingomonas sediminicola]|uniref:prolyl oligopeptidase family serine peptidase n=1 Tax=Sphingomonas TaxID=13687 RepID=UPI001963C423
MRHHLFLLSLPIAAFSSIGIAAPMTAASTAAPSALAYPQTRRENVSDTIFGTVVADPYRWLETDARNSPEVRNWVNAENGVTNAFLATLPGRDTLKARMTELYNYERTATPVKKGGRYFYQRNTGLQNQSPLYVRDSLNGRERLLADPNTWSKDGATALAEWTPSEDGKYLLYSVQDGGTDWRTVKVIDVATGQPTSDEIKWVKTSAGDWMKDGSGFFYTRFPEPPAGATFQATNENSTIYFHKLGTPQSADRKVYATPDLPKRGHYGMVTEDGRYLLILTTEGTDNRNEVRVVDLKSPNWTPRTLIGGLTDEWSPIGSRGTTFYFQTNKGAPRLSVVSLDIAQANPQPRTVIAEQAATLDGVNLVGGRLIASYLEDAKSAVHVHDLNGKLVRTVALPGLGTASGFGGEDKDNETFFAFSSFNRPTTIYRYDVASGQATPWASPKLTFNPDDITVEQRFYNSKDGTRVPLFIVRKKGTTGPAPTLLYGYGGFNISLTPSFSPTRLAWVEQGGVWAQANIRGGGEYGKAWHDAGRLSHKQNVFDDFIAAGEYLKAQGITGANQLAVEGGSNGGLLIGAVVNQRPDLFAAAHPAVGVMDMLRFDRFTAGRYWVDDYGYPNKEADFRTLLTYSPYHNIKTGVRYPAVLVTTADTDDRVVPGHSFKYISALQHADPNGQPHLIRIETRAGHGSGKPTDKIIEESSDVQAFLAKYTGLAIR